MKLAIPFKQPAILSICLSCSIYLVLTLSPIICEAQNIFPSIKFGQSVNEVLQQMKHKSITPEILEIKNKPAVISMETDFNGTSVIVSYFFNNSLLDFVTLKTHIYIGSDPNFGEVIEKNNKASSVLKQDLLKAGFKFIGEGSISRGIERHDQCFLRDSTFVSIVYHTVGSPDSYQPDFRAAISKYRGLNHFFHMELHTLEDSAFQEAYQNEYQQGKPRILWPEASVECLSAFRQILNLK